MRKIFLPIFLSFTIFVFSTGTLLAEDGADAKAALTTGMKYFYQKDFADAYKWFKIAADQDNSDAERVLGFLYQYGLGVDKDYQKAFEYTEKSAMQGNALGESALGSLYEVGMGVKQDQGKAFEWFKKSAEQGNSTGQAYLGFFYFNGVGVAQDYVKALEWFKKSAEQGDASGECGLGMMYGNGLGGVPKDMAKAFEWTMKSANQGSMDGECNLGLMFQNGLGVEKDYLKALAMFTKAAKDGNVNAIYYLAGMYENGQGTTVDMELAKKLYQAAAQKGNSLAEDALQRLEHAASTPGQITYPDSDVDSQIPSGGDKNPDGVAVVLGVRDYDEKDVPAVDYAIHDAMTFRTYLVRTLGFKEDNILYYENPSKGKLEAIFGTETNPQGKLADWVKPGKSPVFVYYVGHGIPSLEDGRAYLAPADCDPSKIALTGYPLNTFYKNLARLKAVSVTVVIDACFSGGSNKGTLVKGASPLVLSSKAGGIVPKGIEVFTASEPDQVASWYADKSHGLFTYFFLKGLQQGIKTCGDMDHYLKEQIPPLARRLYGDRHQMPFFTGNADRNIKP